jgi:hypothetical protein
MNRSIVDAYSRSILRPQLRALGLNIKQQSIILADVCRRLNSLLAHWSDSRFRQTALLCGVEEATFYNPRSAELDVRALVVVGVRNSLIEDLGASTPSTPELKLRSPVLSDSNMPVITSEAIKYFSKINLTKEMEIKETSDTDDVFGLLSKAFPNAWLVLSHLANCSGSEITYELPDAPPPDLPSHGSSGDMAESVEVVVSSGIDSAIDPLLVTYLNQVTQNEGSVFFSDSFKGVTRNPQKLLRIIEFLINNKCIFMTHNYLIGHDYAARRQPLLRPFHFSSELTAKLSNQLGLCDRHQESLDSIKAQLEV